MPSETAAENYQATTEELVLSQSPVTRSAGRLMAALTDFMTPLENWWMNEPEHDIAIMALNLVTTGFAGPLLALFIKNCQSEDRNLAQQALIEDLVDSLKSFLAFSLERANAP